MTDSTNPDETSMDIQPRSLPKCLHISTRCYVTNSHIGKSVHLLLGQNNIPEIWRLRMFINHLIHFIPTNKWFIADTTVLWTFITM